MKARFFSLLVIFLLFIRCSPENLRSPASVISSNITEERKQFQNINQEQQEGYAYSFCSALRSAWTHWEVRDDSMRLKMTEKSHDCSEQNSRVVWQGEVTRVQNQVLLQGEKRRLEFATIKSPFFAQFCSKILDGEAYENLLSHDQQVILSLGPNDNLLTLVILSFSPLQEVKVKEEYVIDIDRQSSLYGMIIEKKSAYSCSSSSDFQEHSYHVQKL